MENGSQEDQIIEVDPARLLPNTYQVRQPGEWPDPNIDELTESIRKSGLIELPVVRETEKGIQIVAGHRRVQACIKLGLKIIKCILRHLTDEQTAEIPLEENLKRKSLSPIEEARGYSNIRKHFHRSEDWIANRFGVTRDIVAQRLRLLTFPEAIQDLVAKGQLSSSHAEAINMAPPTKQIDLAKTVLENKLTVEKTSEEAKRLLENEKLNEQVSQNIGSIYVEITRQLQDLKLRIARAESSLVWYDLFSLPWQQERCKFNNNESCHGLYWKDRPSDWIKRLRGIVKFKKLEDGNWHIQACHAVCAHCPLYEQTT